MRPAANLDWVAIRQEYAQNPAISEQQIAEKYGVNYHTVRHRARRDRWQDARADYQQTYAQRLTELSMHKDAPALIRDLNEEHLKQSKELRYMLNSKLKVRDVEGKIVVRPDVSVPDIVRAISGFAELFRMDRLALGASTDNIAPGVTFESRYDEMSEDELIAELKRVRAQSTIN